MHTICHKVSTQILLNLFKKLSLVSNRNSYNMLRKTCNSMSITQLGHWKKSSLREVGDVSPGRKAMELCFLGGIGVYLWGKGREWQARRGPWYAGWLYWKPILCYTYKWLLKFRRLTSREKWEKKDSLIIFEKRRKMFRKNKCA